MSDVVMPPRWTATIDVTGGGVLRWFQRHSHTTSPGQVIPDAFANGVVHANVTSCDEATVSIRLINDGSAPGDAVAIAAWALRRAPEQVRDWELLTDDARAIQIGVVRD